MCCFRSCYQLGSGGSTSPADLAELSAHQFWAPHQVVVKGIK